MPQPPQLTETKQPFPQVMGLDELLSIQFQAPKIKRKKEYGHKLAKNMWSYITTGHVGYYADRYRRWGENALWLKGEIDERQFISYMGIQGNQAWINIDLTIIKVIPRYFKSIINRWLERDLKPSVKATDILSAQYKKREEILARARMQNADKIKKMEAMYGGKLADGFMPEDEDALELYYKTQYRMPEEAFMEDTVWQVFQNSDFEYLSRETLQDGFRTNLMTHKLEELPYDNSKTLAERLRIRRCWPMNTVYNIFKMSNGADISIVGEAFAYKISDARRKYPNISEEEWFKLAQIAQKGLDQAQPLNWTDTYVYSFNRPYDDYSVILFDFEVKVFDQEFYVQQKDRNGNDFAIEKKGRPINLGSDKKLIESGKFNMYAGVYAPVADIMMDWHVVPNALRPFQNGVDVFSSYSVVYPDADGFYVPALVERGIPPVRQMILIALKMQQMIALMEPDGLQIDRAGLQDLDLGTGNLFKPMDTLKLKQQTGTAWWDSTDTTGVGVGGEQKQSPYQPKAYAANVAQLNILQSMYNFWLMRLNDEWGENAETMGQPTPGKKSAEATRTAAAMGTQGTEYIYDFFVQLLEQDATKIVYRLWDMLVLEGAQYKEFQNADQNAQDTRSSQNEGKVRDLLSTSFDVNLNWQDKKSKKERQRLRIEAALQAGLISMSTAERLEDIENPKDAILYLEKLEKRQKKDAMAKEQHSVQLNATVQQQSTEIATQGKIKLEMAKAQAKAAIEGLKGDENNYKELVKLVTDAEKESQKSGVPLPPEVQAIRDIIIPGVIGKEMQKQQAQQQQAQAAQQPQQGQQAA